MDYSASDNAMRARDACWWYYIMKIVDLLDTVSERERDAEDEKNISCRLDDLHRAQEGQSSDLSACLSSSDDASLRLVWSEIRSWWSR